MIISGAGIAGVADVGDHLALLYGIAFSETVGVAREVCVIENEIPVCVELINRRAAALAVKEFENLAVCGGEYGCFSGCHYIDRVVHTAFGAGVVEGVDELVR